MQWKEMAWIVRRDSDVSHLDSTISTIWTAETLLKSSSDHLWVWNLKAIRSSMCFIVIIELYFKYKIC